MIRFEHTAYNVEEPEKVAAWYASALNMDIIRASSEGFRPQFVSDRDRRMTWEFYRNPAGAIPDHSTISVWTQHVAFVVDDMQKVRAALIAAGARADGDITTSAIGDRLCFLRDPWGLCLQLVQRATPLF